MQVDIFTFLLIIWPKALAIVSVAVRFKVSVVIIRILRASVLSAHKKLEKICFIRLPNKISFFFFNFQNFRQHGVLPGSEFVA